MTTSALDRRSADRRRGDRRRADRRSSASGWADDPTAPGAAQALEAALAQELGLSEQFAQAGDADQARIQRTYAAARAAVGVGLVGAQVVLALLGGSTPLLAVLVSMAYAVQALTLWLLPQDERGAASPARARQRGRRQWLVTIGVDLLCFSALHVIAAGTTFNFAALLVLPVLMAGVTAARLLALGTAAAVTLLLLVVAWRNAIGSNEMPNLLAQSGLAGLGLFVIALLAGEMSARLAREQRAARGSLELARRQVLINRLVIEEMADGVLVVDRLAQVRAANPAARALIVPQGLSPTAPFSLQDRSEWRAVAQAAQHALAAGNWPEEGRDLRIDFDGGYGRTVRMRVRFIRGGALDEEQLALLLLEDVRTAQARIRQEKLAAMGRVSAGIAHEIRNPLAAIAQANALLQEDVVDGAQQRLTRIVADNVERLKRLVDDVMEVAPGAPPARRVIDATQAVGATAADWAATVGLPLGTDSRLRVELPATPLGVVFDAEHLRRVLVNLLDNAGRHASASPGAVFLRLVARDEGLAQLSVLSDSDLISPEVERYLFEPFFSTRSRGSGLGLYICRELCERYDASIEYRARPAAERLRNEFVVTMRRAELSALDGTLPLPE